MKTLLALSLFVLLFIGFCFILSLSDNLFCAIINWKDRRLWRKFIKDAHDDAYEAWFSKYVLKNYPDFRITSDLGVWLRSGIGDGSYECYIHCDETGLVDTSG